MNRLLSMPMALIALGAVIALMFSSCREDAGVESEVAGEMVRSDFVKESEIAVGADGLAYVEGETGPFTGAVVTRDKHWRPRYFAYYFEGELHGPEMRWREDGTLKRIFDYHHGEMNRRREYFANGNIDMDAMMEDGESIGRHLRWFDDGRVRWQGSFKPDLQWHGPIKDFAEDGTVLWDAEFDHGRYIRGIYPESEKQNLIDNGMLNEDGTPTAGE